MSRQLFTKIQVLQTLEHDASGTQLAIASRGLNPNRSFAEFSIKPLAHLTLIPGLRRKMLRTHAKGSIYNVKQTLPSAIDLENIRSIWLLGCNTVYEISASSHIYGGLTQNYRPVLFSDHYAQTPNEKVVFTPSRCFWRTR